jgi:hypothetical protein
MNEALEFYKEDKRIWSISGYNPNINIGNYTKDIYLNYRASSWGWATWKDRWEKNDWEISDYKEFIKNKKLQKEFNRGGDDMTEMLIAQIEGKIDSWAIRWCYNQFKYKMYTIYPIVSKVKNIGMDGTGVHCGVNYNYDVVLDDGRKKIEFDLNLSEDKKLLKEFKKTFEPKTIKGKIGKHLKKIGLYNIVKGWIR